MWSFGILANGSFESISWKPRWENFKFQYRWQLHKKTLTNIKSKFTHRQPKLGRRQINTTDRSQINTTNNGQINTTDLELASFEPKMTSTPTKSDVSVVNPKPRKILTFKDSPQVRNIPNRRSS